MQQLSDDKIAIWKDLVESRLVYLQARSNWRALGSERVELIRYGLMSRDKLTAIHMLTSLNSSELQELFPELMFLASYAHGAIQAVRDAILSVPRKWVLDNIEKIAEPLLENGTYDEYRRFLELYTDLDDRDMVLRLAHRAAAHADFDIREAGEDYLGESSRAKRETSEDESAG